MRPKKSYIIWFTQRTGSTLLCKALESTGVAGVPNEWLTNPDLMETYNADSYTGLQEKIWDKGTTPNGIYGLKHGYYQPHNNTIMDILKKFPGGSQCSTRAEIWENAFPHCKHIFMTRRNKIRLAVSWWKAIKTNEFHRKQGASPKEANLGNNYSYDAINQLVAECVFREAGIQEFFSEGNITPLTIVYEDFVNNYEETVIKILEYLEVPGIDKVNIAPPYYEKLADELSEEWVQRFRKERQNGWSNVGW